MKKLLVLLVMMSSSVMLFPVDRVVYSENFENATSETIAGETLIGDALAKSYSGGGGVWTVSLESVYPISGSKSAYFNIENTGTQKYALQFRIDSKFPVIKGLQYKTSFKIQSSVANTILFRVQGLVNFVDTVKLTGAYNIQNFEITCKPMDNSGTNAVFLLNFSTPAVPAEIWLDDFKIEELDSPTTVINNFFDEIKIWSDSHRLIIDSPEESVAEVFNMNGQKLAISQVGVSRKATIDIPANEHCVLVKLFNSKHGFKAYKVVMN